MVVRPRRSVLYMPGANARAMEKARDLPADALIFDLEDAVAPAEKETARRQVIETLREGVADNKRSGALIRCQRIGCRRCEQRANHRGFLASCKTEQRLD